MAEKIGINTDQLREVLVEASNWGRIQTLTKELKAKVDLEAMKAQVKADINQDISQALNQTVNQTVDNSEMPSPDLSSQTANGKTSPTAPFVETVVVTARAAKD